LGSGLDRNVNYSMLQNGENYKSACFRTCYSEKHYVIEFLLSQ